MRTFTAIAMALSLLFTVATANATTHKKHTTKKHASTAQGDKTASKDTGKAAPKEKAPATK
jgi:hypothetical protein